MTRENVRPLAKLFVGALAIRWAYAFVLLALMGNQGFLSEDSVGYLARARELWAAVAAGKAAGFDWLGFDPWTMPLFYWLLAPHAVFGDRMQLSYVLFQGALDAGTCLLVYRIAAALDRRYALPAALCAVLNPTQIVLSGIVLTDTPFVFCVALFLLGSVRWLARPSPGAAAQVGAGLAAALLIRILAAPWSAVALAFLFVAALARRQLGRREATALVAAGLLVAAGTGLILWRNVVRYDAWSLTPQGGVHLALWIVPLVKEARDHVPWAQTKQAMEARRQERFGAVPPNPFEQSRQFEAIARPALRDLGIAAMAKAWAFGAAVNLASPGILLSAPLYYSPRTGFYATRGASFFAKVENFLLASGNPVYSWGLLLGIAGAGAVWLLQALGIVTLFRGGDRLVFAFCALWFCYILAINGPVASPKYRLPVEPLLMVAAGAGLSRLAAFRRQPGRAYRPAEGSITP